MRSEIFSSALRYFVRYFVEGSKFESMGKSSVTYIVSIMIPTTKDKSQHHSIKKLISKIKGIAAQWFTNKTCWLSAGNMERLYSLISDAGKVEDMITL